MPRIPARIVIWQFSIGFVAALLWWLLVSFAAGLAAFAGGAISALLSLYMALRVFDRRLPATPASAQRRVLLFYRAETLKILLAVVLFSAAAFFFKGGLLPLITTYLAASLTYFVALLWVD